ncbi:MAG TPA: AMP-binding protein [Pseudonocardia sp.]|jgi:acyl-CoA synthetase (AMP-forming)/AMP-acid ligase II
MHLTEIAAGQPDRAAVLVDGPDGTEALDYRGLDQASLRLAELLRRRGLAAGDRVALLLPNCAEYFPVSWAAQRSGLRYVPVNWHLSDAEAAYIVIDYGAKALVASGAPRLRELAEAVARQAPELATRLAVHGPINGFEPLAAALDGIPAGVASVPAAAETEGSYMFYSSGTTGRPKGILPRLRDQPFGTGLAVDRLLGPLYGFDADSVYLCPGPLYHAAPLGWSLATQRNGGSVVVMSRFDAERMLALIERHRVSHLQCVPTMFSRLLALPEPVRRRYDLSSLRVVVHAAAPCPIDVKHRMIDWLGPIVYEYYGGSEGVCFVHIDTPAWLAHPGSVGRPEPGTVHVVDDSGVPVGPGEVGTLWFSGGWRFEYHNDPERTAAAYDSAGRSTLGDLGKLDEEGYLYLVDRRTDLIISGGVNIYPREVEEVLTAHPAVADAAVVAAPDPDRGHRVHAVVQPAPGFTAGPELAAELIEHCRARLAGYKCPPAIDFDPDLPRLPSGKLLRREIRARYWEP